MGRLQLLFLSLAPLVVAMRESFVTLSLILFGLVPGPGDIGTMDKALAGDARGTDIISLEAMAANLRVSPYKNARFKTPVKVAILDVGFDGYETEVGRTLPLDTRFHEGPLPAAPGSAQGKHGLYMAQILAGLLKQVPALDYELHLFYAQGFSNLRAAVRTIARDQFDVALYAQVWEYGGNGDGKGFINQVVDAAASETHGAGVLWINASGNLRENMYRAPIEVTRDRWAWLPGENQSVRVRCFRNEKGKCPLRVVLSWNDFKDDVAEGTEKDLDLVLADDTLGIIETSGLRQKSRPFPEGEAGSTLYPREIIQTEVEPGLYYIRVKVRSENFNRRNDELKIITGGEFIRQLDTTSAETLMPPADNPNVLTVGAYDSSISSFSIRLGKPELVFPSKVELRNGDVFKGSSNSAAVAAAAAVILKALDPTLNRSEIRAWLSRAASGGQSTPGAMLHLPSDFPALND